MVDPLEAAIALTATDADLVALVASQVAGKHKFGDGWGIPSKAVQLRLDGGLPDLYTPRQVVRLELRCYGESQADAAAVYGAMVGLSRRTDRVRVTTGGGVALVYWLIFTSGPSLLVDPDVDVDYVLAFMEASVSEVDVP